MHVFEIIMDLNDDANLFQQFIDIKEICIIATLIVTGNFFKKRVIFILKNPIDVSHLHTSLLVLVFLEEIKKKHFDFKAGTSSRAQVYF